MGLWKNRIGVTLDAYLRQTRDILYETSLPSQVGNLAGPTRNIAAVDNKGIELTLQYRNNVRDFNYNIWGNVSYNQNEVTDVNGEQIISGATIRKAGYPLNSFYVLQSDGLFQNQEEIDKHATQPGNPRPGFIRFKDINNDGIINGDDRVIVNASGALPKYNFAFGLNLDWKGFSLTSAFQGVAGIKVYPRANLAVPSTTGPTPPGNGPATPGRQRTRTPACPC